MQKLHFGYLFLVILLALASLPQVDIEAQANFYHQREFKAAPVIKQKLTLIRRDISRNRLSFQVGYTTALDRPIGHLAGLQAPSNFSQIAYRQNQIAAKLSAVDNVEKYKFARRFPGKLPELSLRCHANSKTWDWRRAGKVTPVRNQAACGSCWAFATIGAFESSYLIRNNRMIDSSEQCVLNCSGVGSCSGGWWAFDFLIGHGTAVESQYPYTANDQPCKSAIPTSYKAVAWGYVTARDDIPSVAELKSALCSHGPLAVAVYVSPAFQAYTGGVFNENVNNKGVNHGVTLIGWDDNKQAWLIKNSWGTGWGSTADYGSQRGYMWIRYNSNRIGYAAAWVSAKSIFYILPKKYYKFIPKYKFVDPRITPHKFPR